MARDTTKTRINDSAGKGHAYECIQHAGRDGVKLMASLLDICAEPMAVVAGDAGKGEKVALAEVNIAQLGAAVGAAARALVKSGSDELLDELFANTLRDGKPVMDQFDAAYQGNYGELFSAIVFVVKANFGSAFNRAPFGGTSPSETPEPEAS